MVEVLGKSFDFFLKVLEIYIVMWCSFLVSTNNGSAQYNKWIAIHFRVITTHHHHQMKWTVGYWQLTKQPAPIYFKHNTYSLQRNSTIFIIYLHHSFFESHLNCSCSFGQRTRHKREHNATTKKSKEPHHLTKKDSQVCAYAIIHCVLTTSAFTTFWSFSEDEIESGRAIIQQQQYFFKTQKQYDDDGNDLRKMCPFQWNTMGRSMDRKKVSMPTLARNVSNVV